MLTVQKHGMMNMDISMKSILVAMLSFCLMTHLSQEAFHLKAIYLVEIMLFLQMHFLMVNKK